MLLQIILHMLYVYSNLKLVLFVSLNAWVEKVYITTGKHPALQPQTNQCSIYALGCKLIAWNNVARLLHWDCLVISNYGQKTFLETFTTISSPTHLYVQVFKEAKLYFLGKDIIIFFKVFVKNWKIDRKINFWINLCTDPSKKAGDVFDIPGIAQPRVLWGGWGKGG